MCQVIKVVHHINMAVIDCTLTHPFDTIHVDTVGLPTTTGGHHYVLTIIDRFT